MRSGWTSSPSSTSRMVAAAPPVSWSGSRSARHSAYQAQSEVASSTASGTKIWSNRPLQVKEHGLALALEVNVEAKPSAVLARHQRGPAVWVLDRAEDRVGRVGSRF